MEYGIGPAIAQQPSALPGKRVDAQKEGLDGLWRLSVQGRGFWRWIRSINRTDEAVHHSGRLSLEQADINGPHRVPLDLRHPTRLTL